MNLMAVTGAIMIGKSGGKFEYRPYYTLKRKFMMSPSVTG